MGSVSSINTSGMSEMIQLLSSSSSPLTSSGLSSSQIQSALKNASPTDIVHLSAQAIQMQEASVLFGNSDTSQPPSLFSTPSVSSSSNTFDNLISALNSASTSDTSGSNSSSPQSASSSSLATNTANYQSQMQLDGIQSLFGTGSTSGTSGTLLNTLI